MDWTADSTLECAQDSWGTIKAKCDPIIKSTSWMLTPTLKKHLKELQGTDGKLVANPTIDQLRVAAQVFPTFMFELYAGKEIEACLATHVPKVETPTATSAASDVSTAASNAIHH
ncbi:hypothetical protein EC988_002062 [Linderina pennispora]|nr:hypothetical protein EC988_002062 [Linderina pennispora]